MSGALSYGISQSGSEKFEFRIPVLFLTARASSLFSQAILIEQQ